MTRKKRDRPSMPAGYSIAAGTAGMLAWEWAEKRIAASHNYWVVTTRPDGRPHVMPVWGVWVDGRLCFGTDRTSRKARNLSANPLLAVHLEDSTEPVILEGTAHQLVGAAVIAEVDKVYSRKYKMRLTDAPGDLVVFGIQPRVVLAWREKDFPRSATRWRFDSPDGAARGPGRRKKARGGGRTAAGALG